MKLLIINGPNLNMLGIREPEIYGSRSYPQLCEYIKEHSLAHETEIFQSNSEGEIVDKIQYAYGRFDGIIINAAAYTHTSVAILDALRAVGLPTVEVHLSDISTREEFRRHSYVSLYAQRVICGMGFEGYAQAIKWFESGGKDV